MPQVRLQQGSRFPVTRVRRHCQFSSLFARRDLRKRWVVWLLVSVLFVLFGCRGAEPESSAQEEVTLIPESLLALKDDPEQFGSIPVVMASDIRAETGLQLVYTRLSQVDSIPADRVEQQWQYMQTCVALQSAAPIVIFQSAYVAPLTTQDDLIYDIEGIPVASASPRPVALIQVREDDFDGSLGSEGFYLRSIMGRLLWLAADLPVRDYPYHCAQQLD